jgi:predicted Fe-Mo cluster-binding NifX family protein
MKIAISSTEPNPDARVDLRFGRCRCFAIVDVDADTYDYIDNEAAALGGGAGLQAAQMLADAGVNAVITGNIGPNASNVLEAAGIKTYLCNAGTVGEVLQHYHNGLLAEASGSTVSSHFGSGGGAGMGRGMGGGMGQGRAGGQGGGRGGGRGRR